LYNHQLVLNQLYSKVIVAVPAAALMLLILNYFYTTVNTISNGKLEIAALEKLRITALTVTGFIPGLIGAETDSILALAAVRKYINCIFFHFKIFPRHR
jgi:hypothetical protein